MLRFNTIRKNDEGPDQVDVHIVLRRGGEALCGIERPARTRISDRLVRANCVACVDALDLYRAVLGTQEAL